MTKFSIFKKTLLDNFNTYIDARYKNTVFPVSQIESVKRDFFVLVDTTVNETLELIRLLEKKQVSSDIKIGTKFIARDNLYMDNTRGKELVQYATRGKAYQIVDVRPNRTALLSGDISYHLIDDGGHSHSFSLEFLNDYFIWLKS